LVILFKILQNTEKSGRK